MAKVEGEYIAVNDLFGNKSGSALELKGLRYNGVVGRRAVLNGIIKFDHWYTTLSASDFSVNSSGGNVASLASISSYGVDVENESHDLGYDLSQETIGANNTSSSKTHSITVTQRGSGQSLRITATQAARKYSYTDYYSPSVTSVSIGTFAASGNETKYLTVYWTQSYRTYYDNGSYTSDTTSGSSTATITSGSANNSSGAYINNGGIYCPSAGKNTYTSARTVYTISDYYFYANGVYGSGGGVYVSQSANPVTTSTGSLVLSVSSSVSKFSSSGGSATISYQSYKPYTKTWASFASESGETNVSATLSTTHGSLGASSVSGRGSTTLSVGKDTTGSDKTVTITIKAEGTTRTVSITQTKRVVSSTSYSEPSVAGTYQDANIPAWGGTAYLMVNWSQTQYTNYDNNTYTSSPVSGKSRAVILGGTIQQTGASLRSDGGINKNSCGTTVTPQRTVYTVSAYYFEANGVGREVRPVTIHLGQAPNERMEDPTWLKTYNISISYSPTGNLSNAGGTKTISVDCKENGVFTYTATKKDANAKTPTTRDATATLTTTLGDLGTKSITGSGTSTLTVYSNYDEKTKTATVTAKCGSTSKSVSITQAAAVYDFYFVDPGTIDAYGATINITLVSKVNGAFKTVIPDSVKLSGGTVNSVTANESASKYTINVTFPANSSTTSTKSYTISAQQYDTGKTTSLNITQAKKTSSYVTGSVAISSLVSGLYVSSDGILRGFNQYPTFTITAASNGTVNSCKYMFCLDFEIQTSNGQTFNARYEHQMDYIDIQAFSGTKKVKFINFPQSFSLQELTNYGFDPYYSSIMSIRVIADIERVSGSGLLMLGGSISDYTWYV